MAKKNIRNDEDYKTKDKGILFYVSLLLTLGFLSMIFAGMIALFSAGSATPQGNVALIPIKGTIVADGSSDLFNAAMSPSSSIVKMIEKADNDPKIKAIIFEIDSPGGMVVPTDEISQAIKSTEKPTIAWIRGSGASGAYWIATSTDIIFANRMSIVGSIGVTASYLEFSGFIERYNVSYQRIVSGEDKDMGTIFRKLSDREEEMFQNITDRIWIEFMAEVAQNRNMTPTQVRSLSTGRVFLGSEAIDLNLIDRIGGLPEIKEYISEEHGIEDISVAEYRRSRSLLDMLGSVKAIDNYNIGRGIGDSITSVSTEPQIPVIWS